MTEIRSFSAIAAGSAIDPLLVEIERAALIRFAGAADDYIPQHWDHPFMIGSGYPDVIVHGWLIFAHMCRAMAGSIPSDVATIASYSIRYHQPLFPGAVVCGGDVETVKEGEAKLRLWARNGGSEIVTTAAVKLIPAGDAF